MRSKALNILIDVGITSGGVGTIWGLSLAEWDHITKIAGTVIITSLSVVLSILHHRKKK